MSKVERIVKKLESLHKKRAALYSQIAETEKELFKAALAAANPNAAAAKKSETKKPVRKPAGKKPKK